MSGHGSQANRGLSLREGVLASASAVRPRGYGDGFALAHSVGSGARVFVAECDPSCAQQTCFEGAQMVALETVRSQTSLFPQQVASTSPLGPHAGRCDGT